VNTVLYAIQIQYNTIQMQYKSYTIGATLVPELISQSMLQ